MTLEFNNNTTNLIDSKMISNTSFHSDKHFLGSFVQDMVNDWKYNAKVTPWAFGSLISLYALMVLFGVSGNLLVILVVIKNRSMRTARNVFIVNLAVSDLMLCLITMPLTLVEILYQTWQVRIYKHKPNTFCLAKCSSSISYHCRRHLLNK